MKKLYKAGFGEHWHYVAGNDITEAITIVKAIDRTMEYLPCVAEEVIEETGHMVGCLHPDEVAEETEAPIVEVVEVKPSICKKCGESFDNKGEFLAHTRKCGKEV